MIYKEDHDRVVVNLVREIDGLKQLLNMVDCLEKPEACVHSIYNTLNVNIEPVLNDNVVLDPVVKHAIINRHNIDFMKMKITLWDDRSFVIDTPEYERICRSVVDYAEYMLIRYLLHAEGTEIPE